MPTPSKVQTATIDNMALPYITNDSPVGASPRYSSGLNALTSINGILERRPGFAEYLEKVPTTFVNVKRIYVWQRWDDPSSGDTRGKFIAMINDCYNGQSIVYKYQLGGNTENPAVNRYVPSAVVDSGGGVAWVNPANITSNFDFATVSLFPIGSLASSSSSLLCTNPSAVIPVSRITEGIEVSFTASTVGTGTCVIKATLLKNGIPIAVTESSPSLTSTNTVYTIGGDLDLWSETWTAGDVVGVSIQAFTPAKPPFGVGGDNAVKINNLQIGLHTNDQLNKDSAIEIHRDTTSENPFSFVDSNNQCYFGNGTAGNMKRYDATTVRNWGIVKPAKLAVTVGSSANSSNSRPQSYVTPDTSITGTTACSNPQNAFDADASTFATVTGFSVQYEVGPPPFTAHQVSGQQSCRWYGFVIPATPGQALFVDYQIAFAGITGNSVNSTLEYSLDNGSNWTTIKGVTNSSVSRNTFSFALPDTQDFSQVIVRAETTASTATADGQSSQRLDVFDISIGSVPAVPSGSTGGIDTQTGFQYVATFGYGTGTGATALSVGESSPSDLSDNTGPFTDNGASIGLVASTDPQVNQIHVYRTTEGGAADPEEMQELPDSPYANATATITDATADEDLQSNTAPAFNRNDPPPSSTGCVVSNAARIHTFTSNTMYYSGFEEINRGVPEECFPSGLDGNNRPYPKDIRSLGILPDGVAVSMTTKVAKMEGESLDSFRFYNILEKRGTRDIPNMSSLGGSVSWIDSSGTVWNSELGEISKDIRPDTKAINQNNAGITAHISGNFHWIVVMDGDNGKLLVFDVDRSQWCVPWKVAKTITAIGSFETAEGTTDLLIARNGTAILKLTPGVYNDQGDTYSAFVATQQYHISPEQDAQWKGVIDWIEWKRNTTALDSVYQLTDDDPHFGTFKQLTDIQPSPSITQGKFLLTERASSNFPTAQYATIKFVWPAEDKNFQMYQFSVASHPVGS